MEFRILSAVLAGLLSGCQTSSAPLPPSLPPAEQAAWEGRPPLRFLIDSTGGVRKHTLDFMGSDTVRLTLTEHHDDVAAFQAFQAMASSEELQQGFYRDRNSQVFAQGAYIGEIQFSSGKMLPASFLKEKLTFRNEPLFQKPRTFQTFPLTGQIEGSERILTPEFLGSRAKDPLPSMAYECHHDTARLFRGHPPFTTDPVGWLSAASGTLDTLAWGREKRFSGSLPDGKPLILWVFRGATVGVWGCYDEKLAQEYAEKMKKTAILWENP